MRTVRAPLSPQSMGDLGQALASLAGRWDDSTPGPQCASELLAELRTWGLWETSPRPPG